MNALKILGPPAQRIDTYLPGQLGSDHREKVAQAQASCLKTLEKDQPSAAPGTKGASTANLFLSSEGRTNGARNLCPWGMGGKFIAGTAGLISASPCFSGVALAAESSGKVSFELPSIGTAALTLGGLVGGTIIGVILTTRLAERILEAGEAQQALDPKRALADVLSSLREAAPVVGLIITLAGGFLSINSRVESLELKVDAQNTRIDAQNTRIDAQNTRIDALNVRAESELRTLADQTAALRAFNEQIFRLALRQAQEQNPPAIAPGATR